MARNASTTVLGARQKVLGRELRASNFKTKAAHTHIRRNSVNRTYVYYRTRECFEKLTKKNYYDTFSYKCSPTEHKFAIK